MVSLTKNRNNFASSNGKEVFAVKKFTPQDVLTGLSNSLRVIEMQIAKFPSNSEPWKRVVANKATTLAQMKKAINGNRTVQNDGAGLITSGGEPDFNNGLIAPLWFGLVSKRYFEGVTNGFLPAVWTPRASSRSLVPQAPARYARREEYPHLLSWARFFESEDARDKDSPKSSIGMYKGSEWTTNDGVVYPQKTSLSVFYANGEDSIALKIETTIASLSVAPNFTNVDSGVTNIALRDERFKNDREVGGALVYLTERLLTTNEVRTNREYSQQVKQSRLVMKAQRRWPIFFMGAVLVAAPVTLILFKRFRR